MAGMVDAYYQQPLSGAYGYADNPYAPRPQSVSMMMSRAPQPYAGRIPGQLDPRMKGTIGQLMAYADQRGWQPRVLEGFRTKERQDQLQGTNPKASKGLSFHETGQAVDMALGDQPSDSPQMRQWSDFAKTLGMRSGFDFDPFDPGHFDLGERGSPMIGSYQHAPLMRGDPLAGMNYRSAPVMRSPMLGGLAYGRDVAAPASMMGGGYRRDADVRGGNSGSGAGGNQGGASKGGIGPRGRQGAR